MSLESILKKAAVQATKELFDAEVSDAQIQIQKTRKEFDGYLTLVVFPLVRLAKKSPEETGTLYGEYFLEKIDEVTGFNVVKGFLNLEIKSEYWLKFFSALNGSLTPILPAAKSKSQVMVEYSSPNTNKPLHLGHLRNNFLGNSVSRILEAHGHEVIKVQIINDRGIHICKSMLAWQKYANGETPEKAGIKGDKFVGNYYVKFNTEYQKEIAELVSGGMDEEQAKKQAPLLLEAQEMLIKWESRDPEIYALWEKMNSWVYEGFNETYATMGVDFDKLYFESDTYLKGKSEVENGLQKGIFYKKEDGSIWVDLSADGLDEKLLLRSDSTAVYMTQDIGTAILRFTDYPQLSYQIYTVGNEQEYHFRVLFLILDKLGFEQAKNNYHLSYGMVELPEGKMKSREGTVVDADDLMQGMSETAKEIAKEQGKLEGLNEEEREGLYHVIGMAALKYFLLRVDPKRSMLFDPAESIDFNGTTGPFIQYGYVRTRAILRKVGKPQTFDDSIQVSPEAEKLIQKIYEYPEAIADAAKEYSPAIIASYSYELVKEFNSFYQKHSILKESNQDLLQFRLNLTSMVGKTLKHSMNLLGIEMPERM